MKGCHLFSHCGNWIFKKAEKVIYIFCMATWDDFCVKLVTSIWKTYRVWPFSERAHIEPSSNAQTFWGVQSKFYGPGNILKSQATKKAPRLNA